MESLQCNLAGNRTLMRICGYQPEPDSEDDEPVGDIKYHTSSLYEAHVDTMVHTEFRYVNCVCPQSREVDPWLALVSRRSANCEVLSDRGIRTVLPGRDGCDRMGGLSPNAKQRVIRIKVCDGSHSMRIFGYCLRNTRNKRSDWRLSWVA